MGGSSFKYGARPDSGCRFALPTLAGEANSLRQAQPKFARRFCPNLMVGSHGCCRLSSCQKPFQDEILIDIRKNVFRLGNFPV
jgi:hypothetical protein